MSRLRRDLGYLNYTLSSMEHKHTNRLIHETSPYLLQHAHNPVDWYPWGEEAFAKAKKEHRPILLSIGYSACHWCHVMEQESFENEKIAALMNELFVNIKVDREERPDLDEIYMNAVQMLTGRGGWPMTTFLTPEGKPFYGGTYFPPEDRHGMPGFPKILIGVAQAYRERAQDVEKSVNQILAGLQRMSESQETERTFSPNVIGECAERISRAYDAGHGGLGQAPKFPNVGVYELFLRHYHQSKDQRYLDMVNHTLRKMAQGGIYDHLGGGFHRYSDDAKWLVPISRRCSTTTRSWCGCIASSIASPEIRSSNRSSRKPWRICFGKCSILREGSIRLRMPTAKEKRESFSSGLKMR
jgi:uncharacterized protein YyaL (SSP411 family)